MNNPKCRITLSHPGCYFAGDIFKRITDGRKHPELIFRQSRQHDSGGGSIKNFLSINANAHGGGPYPVGNTRGLTEVCKDAG